MYSPDRVRKISEIMPKFSEHVAVGDEIALGLEGDPAYPASYKSSRPVGIVTNVTKTEHTGVDLKVRLQDGHKVKVAAHSIDPRYVWEYTDNSFQKVLQRATESREAQFNSTAIVKADPDINDVSSLRDEIAQVKDMLQNEIRESRAFNNTVIASMNEIAADVCAVNKDAEFCSVLHKEYAKMSADRPLLKSTLPTKITPTENVGHVFESDYDSSDADL